MQGEKLSNIMIVAVGGIDQGVHQRKREEKGKPSVSAKVRTFVLLIFALYYNLNSEMYQ